MNNISKKINKNTSIQYQNENNETNNCTFFELQNKNERKTDIENNDENDSLDNLTYINKYLTSIFDLENDDDSSSNEKDLKSINVSNDFRKTVSHFQTKNNNVNVELELDNTYEYETLEKENEQNFISQTKTLSMENNDFLCKDINFSNENNLKLKKSRTYLDETERKFLEKEKTLNQFYSFNKNCNMKKNEENFNFPLNYNTNSTNKRCEMADSFYEDIAKENNLIKMDDNMLKDILFSLNKKNAQEYSVNTKKKSVSNANNNEMYEEEIIKNKKDVLNHNINHPLKYSKEFIYSYFSNQCNMDNEELKEAFNIEENEVTDIKSNLCNNTNNQFQDSVNGNDKERKKIDNEKDFNIYEKNRNSYSDFYYTNENSILNDNFHNSYIKNTKENKDGISIIFGNSEVCENNSHFSRQFKDNLNRKMDYNNFSQISNNCECFNLNKNYIFTLDTHKKKNPMCHSQLNQNEVFISNESGMDCFNMCNTNSNVKNNTQKKNSSNNVDLMKNPLKYNSKLQQNKNERKKESVEDNMSASNSEISFSKNPILNMNKIYLYELYKNYVENNFNIKDNDSEIHQSLLTFLNNEINNNGTYSINNSITTNSNIDVTHSENKIYNYKNDNNSDLSFQNKCDELHKHANGNNIARNINDRNYIGNINLNEMSSNVVLDKNNFNLDKNNLKYLLNYNIDSNINNKNSIKVNSFNETFKGDEKNKSVTFDTLKNKIKNLLEYEKNDDLLSEYIIDTLNDYNKRKYNTDNNICNDSFKINEKIEPLNKRKADYSENSDIINHNSYNLNRELKEIECDQNINVLQNMESNETNNFDYNCIQNRNKLHYENTNENVPKETILDNILRENKSNMCNSYKSININDLSLLLNNDLVNKNSNQYTNMKNIRSNDKENCLNHCDEFNKMNELINLPFSNSLLLNFENNNQRRNFSADEMIINEKDNKFNSYIERFQMLEKKSFRNKKTLNYNYSQENPFAHKLKDLKEDDNLKKSKNLLSKKSFNVKEDKNENTKKVHYEKAKGSTYIKNKSNIIDKNSLENNFIDNKFENNNVISNSNCVKNGEKERIFEYLQKHFNYNKFSDDYTKGKYQSEKHDSIPNKDDYYLKSKSMFNDKYKNAFEFYENDYLRNEYSLVEKTYNEEEKNNFLSFNKESKFSCRNQKKFDKIWNRNNYLKKFTKTCDNNEVTIGDIKEKLKSKNSMPNLKSKKQSMEIKALTLEEMKLLLTEEDQKDLEKLLQSLYDDRILPLLFNVKGRAEELQYKDTIKNNIKTAYSLYPEKYQIKKNDSADDYIIYFANKKVQDDYFLSINNLKDIYDPSIWKEFEKYLEEIANSENPSLYTFSGGRYGMAKELKRRNLPFFKGLYLGELCHIVHISTNKKIIAYENNYLKPISQCHKYTNAKMGIVNTSGTDIENYITTMDELRLYLNKLLKYYKGGFNISTLKKKLKNRFNKQICESVFHCIKLIEVLQLDELKDVCSVDKQSKIVKSAKDTL
ncbi:conserved Plasmodium protein, unknown function [Plasmodium gallinaceum]|uniref:HTH OST-type domain-containing protein n=1 Tax=Plasmodium gallinaceum TaxID=5849 RepID=A0A1J1GTZ7_PLAGA|nr:conserved Plasmodium protein, unknown function [Plasmodium gallinaceum]CRG95715.1 conserved Plasmodium protein, unknown function [Plasmodium gallinaceum]